MRIKDKPLVISLLETVEEAINYVINKNEEEISEQLLEDSKAALQLISGKFVVHEEVECIIRQEVEACILILKELLYQSEISGSILQQLYEKIIDVKYRTENNVNTKAEIVFFPYKYSMWDSMKSVWECAKVDKNCNCHLVPIPYYDKNSDKSMGEEHYERSMFSEETEDYRDFIKNKEYIDIIYIHNPYDDCNLVTTVHKEFYARELKKYTDMLVYIPYYVAGLTSTYEAMAGSCQLPGCFYADKIIMQSDSLKECFVRNGFSEDKLPVLGSPKIDAVINLDQHSKIPERWSKKLDNKKIILVNTSVNGVLGIQAYLETIRNILRQLSNCSEIGFIWRPHPLLDSTIKIMSPEEMDIYREIMSIVEGSDSGVTDIEPDMYSAIALSDALISDYSSVLMQYTFTGKPALSLSCKREISRSLIVLCDYFDNYFYLDGVTIEDFIGIVLNDEDTRKEHRILNAKRSVCNSEGTSGRQIHQIILQEYDRKVKTK